MISETPTTTNNVPDKKNDAAIAAAPMAMKMAPAAFFIKSVFSCSREFCPVTCHILQVAAFQDS